jgi:hypothetical protein
MVSSVLSTASQLGELDAVGLIMAFASAAGPTAGAVRHNFAKVLWVQRPPITTVLAVSNTAAGTLQSRAGNL